MTEEKLTAACEAFSEAYAVYPDGRGKTPITDWFELDAQDAVDFNVLTSAKWSSHSDIRSDEYRAYVAAVIREPMRAALAAAEERGRMEERERCATEPSGCAREIDELLYRLEPFLKAEAVITERPSEYQPVVARIGGMMNACDLRVIDFQRLATAAAITKEPTP